MKERFEGQNEQHLIDALKRQEFADGNIDIATALKQNGELVEFAKDDLIVAQNAEDNDLFFLLSGAVAIVVKSNQVATRKAGQLVGEMAAVEPSLKRSADVRALDTVVALKINSATFGEIGRKYPQIWQPVARELSRRLNERNNLIPPPNDAPKLFHHLFQRSDRGSSRSAVSVEQGRNGYGLDRWHLFRRRISSRIARKSRRCV
jgi:CRP/FNR family cyclic AMP-dependent transcriptional regulator